MLKVEAKVDIQPYEGEVNVVKLNHWLQHLKVYFSEHNIGEEWKIASAKLKLEGHAHTWWNSCIKTLRLENDPPLTKWEVFKDLIKSQFYSIGYEEAQRIQWHDH